MTDDAIREADEPVVEVRWGVLRLLSRTTDTIVDLGDTQFWFRQNPQHHEIMQVLINLSGAQWTLLKDLSLVKDRTETAPAKAAAPVTARDVLLNELERSGVPETVRRARAAARSPSAEAWALARSLAREYGLGPFERNIALQLDAFARVWTKIDQIRAKQAAKPKNSPLPEVAAPADSEPNAEEWLRPYLFEGEYILQPDEAKIVLDAFARKVAEAQRRSDGTP